MSFCQLQWSSQILQKQVAANVILPDCGEPPFPVYYLLHGLSDDYTIWHRRTRIEWTVRELPLIVVMPDGFRGFYTNNDDGPDYASYIAEELPALVERQFAARPDRSARCIGGLSMGGYGALRLALGYPDRYVSATSHSGALLSSSRLAGDPTPFRHREMERIFGADPRGTDHDLVTLAERCQAAGVIPRLRIDCGTDDGLLGENRALHSALERLGIEHEYAEYPGDHNWDYWEVHVQESLSFHCGALGISAGM